MTVIVAITDGRIAIVAGDSCSSNGQTKHIEKPAKVFKKGGMIFGFTTSWRIGQALQYGLALPAHHADVSIEQYMHTVFIDAVRNQFKQAGCAEIQDSKEEGGTFIVAYKGRVFEVQSDFSILEPSDHYAAVGSGSFVALGALAATEGMNNEERIQRALEAAAKHNPFVSAPFVVIREEQCSN